MLEDRLTLALRIATLAHSLGDYDSNVLGMVGEVIAVETLRMTKARKQSKGIDGHIQVGTEQRSVQVKALSSARIAKSRGSVKFRVDWGTHPELLVVLLVFAKIGKYEVLFNGCTQSIGRCEVVKGVQRRGVRVSDLYKNREHELQELVHRCQNDS